MSNHQIPAMPDFNPAAPEQPSKLAAEFIDPKLLETQTAAFEALDAAELSSEMGRVTLGQTYRDTKTDPTKLGKAIAEQMATISVLDSRLLAANSEARRAAGAIIGAERRIMATDEAAEKLKRLVIDERPPLLAAVEQKLADLRGALGDLRAFDTFATNATVAVLHARGERMAAPSGGDPHTSIGADLAGFTTPLRPLPSTILGTIARTAVGVETYRDLPAWKADELTEADRAHLQQTMAPAPFARWMGASDPAQRPEQHSAGFA